MKLNEMLDDVKVKEVDDDMRDLDLATHGSELDQDNDDPDFKQTPMIVQVGKVLDSRGNPNPVDTVSTDDGKEHKINPVQAKVIQMLLTTDKVKPDVKRQFTKDVQNSDTLAMLLKAGDQNAMIQAFLKKYNPERPEKSNYA